MGYFKHETCGFHLSFWVLTSTHAEEARDLIVQYGDLRCGFVYGFVATPDMETGKENGNGKERPNLSTIFYRSIVMYLLCQRLLKHTLTTCCKIHGRNTIHTQTTHGKSAEMMNFHLLDSWSHRTLSKSATTRATVVLPVPGLP